MLCLYCIDVNNLEREREIWSGLDSHCFVATSLSERATTNSPSLHTSTSVVSHELSLSLSLCSPVLFIERARPSCLSRAQLLLIASKISLFDRFLLSAIVIFLGAPSSSRQSKDRVLIRDPGPAFVGLHAIGSQWQNQIQLMARLGPPYK